jgi:hypothetical protein
MRLEDYIRGERLGAGAHDLELEAMRDPLLADALDGFDAVPGDHAAAFARLAARIEQSGAGGHAAARARSSRMRESRIRGWSIAAASLFLVAAAGGGVWLFKDGVPADNTPDRQTTSLGHRDEVIEILPPVTVIEDETTQTAPTETDGVKFDRAEVPVVDEGEVAAGLAAPERDTVVTAAFRQYLLSKTGPHDTTPEQEPIRVDEQDGIKVIAFYFDDGGPVTLSFDVDAHGRPRNIEVIASPNGQEAAGLAKRYLSAGPDWPTQPSRKLITIDI